MVDKLDERMREVDGEVFLTAYSFVNSLNHVVFDLFDEHGLAAEVLEIIVAVIRRHYLVIVQDHFQETLKWFQFILARKLRTRHLVQILVCHCSTGRDCTQLVAQEFHGHLDLSLHLFDASEVVRVVDKRNDDGLSLAAALRRQHAQN